MFWNTSLPRAVILLSAAGVGGAKKRMKAAKLTTSDE
jgi:hypothetical protein